MTTAGLDEMGGGVKLLSLCSGYGGLDLAVESVFGAETVAFAEVDPHAAKVFARHWPDVPNLGDIAAADWTPWAGVDVVTAGFPCQDLSYAGKGAGIREGTRSGLWYAIEDALGVLRPRLVVLENVSAIVARRPGLDVVLAGLARLGFDAEWACVRASDVGAPHRRERWFLVATDPNCGGWERWGAGDSTAARRGREGRLGGPARTGSDVAADADGQGPQGQRRPSDPQQDDGHAGRGVRTAPADTASIRRAERWTEADGRRVAAGGERAPTDPANLGRERSGGTRRWGAGPQDGCQPIAWGDRAPAIRRWGHILGRPAPAPTDRRGRLAPPFVEWMMGLPAGWVTDTPDLSRAQQLEILGNGVVPQQAAAALRLLLDARDRLPLDAREVAA